MYNRKKERLIRSCLGGMILLIGLLAIISGAGGVEMDTIGPFDLLLSCLIGFALMAAGGIIVIKANEKED